jgi:periplasmic protein TonB
MIYLFDIPMKTFILTLCLLCGTTFLAQAQTSSGKQITIPIAQHYQGGEDSLVAFINEKLVYPVMAKRNRIQGTCIVKLKLDEFGKLSDLNLVKNIGGGCGEEALRVVRLLQFNAPGYSAIYSIPVNFIIK